MAVTLFGYDLEMFCLGKNIRITDFKIKEQIKANSQTHASTPTHFASSQIKAISQTFGGPVLVCVDMLVTFVNISSLSG